MEPNFQSLIQIFEDLENYTPFGATIVLVSQLYGSPLVQPAAVSRAEGVRTASDGSAVERKVSEQCRTAPQWSGRRPNSVGRLRSGAEGVRTMSDGSAVERKASEQRRTAPR